MTCLYPAYAIGIRAMRPSPRDAFGLPRCTANALHGMAEGSWELHSIAPGEPIPPGWRVYQDLGDRVVIRLTHWERIIP